MERKRILITGGSGFLGSHLCDRFIKEDYHVIAMDNLITGRLKNIEHLFPFDKAHLYQVPINGFHQKKLVLVKFIRKHVINHILESGM